MFSHEKLTMERHPLATSFTPANKMHACVLFWIGVAMCAMSISAIIAAEAFMPDNAGGQQGITIFYRVFGTLLVIESALVGWALGQAHRMA
jgi:hypothetical protein